MRRSAAEWFQIDSIRIFKRSKRFDLILIAILQQSNIPNTQYLFEPAVYSVDSIQIEFFHH